MSTGTPTGRPTPVRSSEPVPFLDISGATNDVAEEIRAGWDELLRNGQYVGGKAVAAFEKEWAEYCGTEFAVGVANGTDALHLAIRALGIGPGDEVIVPANTFVATAEAVVLAGAVPRFADVDDGTLLLTPETIKAAVTPATKAVAVVHLYGQLPDMTAITQICDELGLVLIEDAAQAQGATWNGRKAGSFGKVGCFSFYPGKNLGAFGDAGAVVTSDAGLTQLMLSVRDHGRMQSEGGHYSHGVLGMNSRLDGVQAVVLSAKLRHLDGWNQQRRALMATYRELIDPARAKLVEQLEDGEGVHHLAVVQVDQRDRVRELLQERGIGTGIHYPVPCHVMGPYEQYADGPLPVAEAAAARQLSLPMFPHLSQDDARRVAEGLNEVLAELDR
ncbi:DegT/DnrJ/EryC1/StrS family aminotransferase [Kribbella koreensis]|uniref:DegT/DnrJ/EryC1/StrS family aminotransferase n=2 Tax=Kribbella TaxID=182639 RepID=A0ABP6YGB9_9ACTN